MATQTVHITNELHRRLKIAAAQRGLSLKVLVHEGLALYLDASTPCGACGGVPGVCRCADAETLNEAGV